MFDIGWSELLVIAVVTLVVVGPKDLPHVLYTAGKWVRRARSMAREFQGSLDEMMREAELDELKRQAQAARNLNLRNEAEKVIDPTGTLRTAFEAPKLDPLASGTAGHAGSPPEEVEGEEAMVDLPVRPRTPPSAAKAYEPSASADGAPAPVPASGDAVPDEAAPDEVIVSFKSTPEPAAVKPPAADTKPA